MVKTKVQAKVSKKKAKRLAVAITDKQKKAKFSAPLEAAHNTFPVVGIGASAGGLEAFLELFRLMPPDSGMAFVLIQHLSPTHLSMLSTLVQRTTRMPVIDVTDGMPIEPNKVYVIPPNSILETLHGVLSLRPMSGIHSVNRLVDTFFASLAHDHKNLAIGVILSGTGSDGSQGLRDIKAAGGISLVQDPKSAKYDGMPSMAIKIDYPDRILDIADLVKELVRIAQNPRPRTAVVYEQKNLTTKDEMALRKIFIAVRSSSGTDFSVYKCPTILRRIKRRMLINDIENMTQYNDFLQSSPAEAKTLFAELIINVTHFFRDPQVFESLKIRVFPEILKNRPEGEPVRVWVPGCATGEEVYTIAISLLEYLDDIQMRLPLQVYGTDVGDAMIKKARLGLYPAAIETQVSSERLKRFFVKEQDSYKIGKAVRECCVFSVQDVTTDPPIHRLDLLSCRNLLIYLGMKAQQRLMETFFYAIKPRGFLLLGPSESLGAASTYFSAADDKNKIYLKRAAAAPPRRVPREPLSLVVKSGPTGRTALHEYTGSPQMFDPVSAAEKLVLERYAPAWILVNQTMEIVHFKGKTENVVRPRSGQASLHLSKMLCEELLADVRVLIHKAEKGMGPTRKSGVKIRANNRSLMIDVEAVRIGLSEQNHYYLVLFNEYPEVRPVNGKTKIVRSSEVIRLRHELEAAQLSLRSLLDDQSSTSEELQSTNEEVLSANEELQSTNEELETAKEELQSTNEELVTVNEELSQRNSDLIRVNDDLSNLLDSASIAVVMVNCDLLIRRMTPAAGKLLNLTPADIGRRLTDFTLGFVIEDLENKLNEVIHNLSTVEYERRDRAGRYFSTSIRPFKTHDRRVDGAVIVFADIDIIKKKEEHAQADRKYLNAVIQTMHEPLVVLDLDLKVSRANAAFFKTFKADPDTTIGISLFTLSDGQWDIPELRRLLENILPQNSEVKDFVVTHDFESIGLRKLLINAQQLDWAENGEILILLAIRDITGLPYEVAESE